MGKHSARGSQEGRERRPAAAGSGQGQGSGPEFVEYSASGEAPAADDGRPGSGRRRAAPGPGAPDPGVTPPQGVPRLPYGAGGPAARTRGGHPEQREAGGGWGAVGGRGGGPGGLRGPGVPGGPGGLRGPGGPGGQRPPYGMRTMNPPQRPTTGGTGGAAGLMPGPRKEYIDAFDTADAVDCDGDDVFAAGAPGGVPPQRRTQRAATPSGGIGGGSGGDGGSGPDDDEQEPPGKGARGVAKGGKGRTFTGVAAAAVTTVLAVVVAGQVASGPQGGGGKTQAQGGSERGDDAASRGSHADDGRGAARSADSPAPVTYDQKMAALFPLDAKLRGSGAFQTVGGRDKAPGRGQVLRYRVDVEKGLPLDGELFAEAVHKTLNDDRSWGHGGVRTFERVSSGHADFVITLASPGTTAAWCAKSGLDTTEDNVSCDSASTERVMINAYRWAQGARTFGDDKMHSYRQMLINHEVGHRLGHNHEICSKQGALAPVMMQQTKFLSTDGATCRPNAWPFPKG